MAAALLAAQAASPPTPAAGGQAQASGQVSAPFSSGESSSYALSWRLFTAGEAHMRVESRPGPAGSPAVWQGTINVISTGFVSLLFKTDDTVASTFHDGKSSHMCSISMVKTINEGRRHREIRVDFNDARRVAAIKETDLSSGKVARQAEESTPGCAYDIISALYYVRSLPLEVGRTYQLPVNDGGKTLNVSVEAQAREEVKTGAGTFKAIRVEPKVFDGSLFKRSGRMQIWFSDDPQRLLVQLKAKLLFGTISAVLQQVEHK
jgi:hypothetical protein